MYARIVVNILFRSNFVCMNKGFVQHNSTDICLCCFGHVFSSLRDYFVKFWDGEGFVHDSTSCCFVSICVLSSHQFRDGTNAELDLFYLLSQYQFRLTIDAMIKNSACIMFNTSGGQIVVFRVNQSFVFIRNKSQYKVRLIKVEHHSYN